MATVRLASHEDRKHFCLLEACIQLAEAATNVIWEQTPSLPSGSVQLTLLAGDSTPTFTGSEVRAAETLLRLIDPQRLLGADDVWGEGICEHWRHQSHALLANTEERENICEALNSHLQFRTYVGGSRILFTDLLLWHTLANTPGATPCEKWPHLARWRQFIGTTAFGRPDKIAATETSAAMASKFLQAKTNDATSPTSSETTNFIQQIVEDDLRSGRHSKIVTRFPPEPNGFLHIGHAKSICLNYGLAAKYNGTFHLRFDDTNPAKEEDLYIESIKEDVRWLGADWGDHLYHASDYFEQMHQWAVDLIKKGLAYVDEQSEDEVKKNRGDITTLGVESPYRNRPVEENLDLFARMRKGEFAEGHCVLRAKIDMTSGNMNLRDPLIYRIKHCAHPRTQSRWCIYPIYDFAHGQEDSIEKITHSICTLEFEDHRPLYDWFQDKLDIFRTRQIEFARLNMSYTVMSKRRLLELVQKKVVEDWDDPRMPTICGMRRRGVPSSALRTFCERVGVSKRDTIIQIELLESCIREALEGTPRRFAVISPLEVEIVNYPENQEEEFVVPNHPEIEHLGTRKMKFCRNIFIDRTDFLEDPPKGFFRLMPGGEVRLRYAYWIKCVEVLRDRSTGEVKKLKCMYDPLTKGGNSPPDGRKVKGTIQWVSASHSVEIEARQYDRLFTVADPDENASPVNGTTSKSWRDFINPNSLRVSRAVGEMSLDGCPPGSTYQFERVGFFTRDKRSLLSTQCLDGLQSSTDPTTSLPIFHRTLELVDTWAAKTEVNSKAAQAKDAQKLARERAAAERQRKKEEREKRLAEKEK